MQAAAARGVHAVALAADITDAAAVGDEIARLAPTQFLHLAGISFIGHADVAGIYDVNLLGTIHILEALARLAEPPRKVVLASSATVYGSNPSIPTREDHPTSPTSHYAISKLAMEQMAHAFAPQLPIVVARAFNYTGPGQSSDFVIPKLVAHFRERAASVKLGRLDVQREFNDVRYVCAAYLGLLEHGLPGETYNVCSGSPHPLREVIETLVRLAGRQIEVETDPSLVRPNEIPCLCGDPAKLRRTVGALPTHPLEDTLQWMLTAPAA